MDAVMLYRQAALPGCYRSLWLEVLLAIYLHPRPHHIPIAHPHHSGRLHLAHPCTYSLIICWHEPGKRIAFHMGEPESLQKDACVHRSPGQYNALPGSSAAGRGRGVPQPWRAPAPAGRGRIPPEQGRGRGGRRPGPGLNLQARTPLIPTAPARATQKASEALCCRREC